MKKWMFLLALVSASAVAQTRPPGAISQPANQSNQVSQTQSTTITTDTDASTAGGMTFTNASGTTYTVEQLAEQLNQLRTAIDQAVPVLSAFNESYSNLNSNQTLTGRISNLLGGALNRNAGQTNSTSQASTQLTNLLSGLQRYLGKTSTNAPAFDATAVRELGTLQKDLQPVVADLQKLNVTSSSTNDLAQPNTSLTPTGRRQQQ